MKNSREVLILFAMIAFSGGCAFPAMAQEKKDEESAYTIKQGDTLWDLSSKFLKDPFSWPILWQRNPYITNPHWIYPGNPVRFSPLEEVKKEEPVKGAEERPKEEMKGPEKKAAEPPPPPEKQPQAIAERKGVEEKPVSPEMRPQIRPERSAGYFWKGDYQGIGILLESREGKSLMSEGDIVYLAFRSSERVLIGNRYTLFRRSELIKHPAADRHAGRRYNITGNVEIIDQSADFYTARVIEAFEPIFKGDRVEPYLKEKMEAGQRK